jgi:hypothetical protein
MKPVTVPKHSVAWENGNRQCTMHKWEFLVEVSSGPLYARPVQQLRIISAEKSVALVVGDFYFGLGIPFGSPEHTKLQFKTHKPLEVATQTMASRIF